jgi:hypothetical protein
MDEVNKKIYLWILIGEIIMNLMSNNKWIIMYEV